MIRISGLITIAAAALLASAACSPATDTAARPDDEGQLIVFAATSLSDAFTELAGSFEADSGATVTLQFAGSQVLSRQLIEGANADVFATADMVTMDRITDAGVTANSPEIFTDNVLALVTPPDNPGDVTGLDDLAEDDLVVALCAIDVPCGRASAAVLADVGITASADTLEASVRSTLSKVALGEADAALVYRSDAISASDRVFDVALAEAELASVEAHRQAYPIVVTTDVGQKPARADLARRFIDFLQSDQGQRILDDHGFGG